MTADPLRDCPKCGGELKRIIGTGAGPIFKGSGFYQTDYKNTKKESAKESKPTAEVKKTTGDKKTE